MSYVTVPLFNNSITQVQLTEQQRAFMQDRSCCSYNVLCMPRVVGLGDRDYHDQSITERHLTDFFRMRRAIILDITIGSIFLIGGFAGWQAGLDPDLDPANQLLLVYSGTIFFGLGIISLTFILGIMTAAASQYLTQAGQAYDQELNNSEL